MPEDWLTTGEAAAALGISARTVCRRCVSGELPARLEAAPGGGKVWRVDPSILEREDSGKTIPEDVPPQRAATVPPRIIHESGRGKTIPEDVPPREDTAGRQREDSVPPQQAVQIARLEGALVGQAMARLEVTVAQAVQEATAPLLARLEAQEGQINKLLELVELMAHNGAQDAPQAPINPPAIVRTGGLSTEPWRPVKRKIRPLWKVIMGIR